MEAQTNTREQVFPGFNLLGLESVCSLRSVAVMSSGESCRR